MTEIGTYIMAYVETRSKYVKTETKYDVTLVYK